LAEKEIKILAKKEVNRDLLLVLKTK